MKTSDLLVKCLEEEGVEYVFAVPGEENIDILESLRTSKIKVIINRHEQASAFMAATYGKLTGKAGVCMSTLGPGATNLVTGIAHAQLGGIPLLAITGQKPLRENWQANFQILDVVHMMAPLTKRSVQIQDPISIPMEIRESFKFATTERMGACHLELPEDIAGEAVDDRFQPQTPVQLRRPIVEQKALNNTVQLILNAKDPIIVVSSRAQRHRVKASLEKLCDTTNLYVITTQLGKGAFDPDHKNSMHAFGIHKHDYVNCIMECSDLIITVGYSIIEHPPSLWNSKLDKKIIHIDFTPAKPDIYYNPICEPIGDIATTLDKLRDELQKHGYNYKSEYHEETKKELQTKLFVEGADDPAFPLRPRRIVADCRKALDKKDIICLDNGIYKLWFSRHYKTYDVGKFLIDNTLATMGAGLPSAIVAKLIRPDKRVLAVCGDGGFMMNSQELETAIRLGLNVVVLILNDNAFGFIKWKQQLRNFQDFALDFGNPDFVKYAESYSAIGYSIKSAEELLPTLEKAFTQEKPVVIDCPVDYSENKSVWGSELDGIVCLR
jgi:acetolactate synthase-1/2/3 large subunit